MTKVLFFISSLEEGGAQRVVSILSNELVKRDFDVEILEYFNEKDFYDLDSKIKITSVIENTKSTNKKTNTKWIKKYFKNSADVIISFLAPFNMMAILANKGNDVPLIVADRNDPRKVPSNFIVRKLRDYLYTKADGVVLQTNDNLSYFNKRIQKNSVVIVNPFDIKDKNGIALTASKENVIVNVARLEKQKNQKMLIEAFNELKDELNDYRLEIYGEGNYRKELEALIKTLNLQNKVILKGEQDDILNKIKTAKLFVLSSNYEGMPNSLIEAMCIGLPVISTRVSGSNELIENENNGLLIDINNKEQLKNTIKKILNDSNYSNNLANNATKICEIVDSNVVVDKWIDFINKVKK